MDKLKIVLLFGGQSSEHEVSLTSAASIMKAIDRDHFSIVPVLIDRKGAWYWINDPDFMQRSQTKLITEKEFQGKSLVPVFLDYTRGPFLSEPYRGENRFESRIDVIFPVLHGPFGEDGTIQGLCKLAGIPCVGAGVLGSAAGMDKVVMKHLFQQNGLPLAPYLHFTRKKWASEETAITERAARELGFPLFVKPANAGSSVGVGKVKEKSQLPQAVRCAARFDAKIILEKGISARECECAVLGNDDPIASVIGEVIPCHEFYDYEAKYLADGSKTLVPADIPDWASERMREMAVSAFKAVDCSGMARVDFLVDRETMEIFVNEINTIPGFTSISMYPMLWKASGIPYDRLIARLIELALEKFEESRLEIQA